MMHWHEFQHGLTKSKLSSDDRERIKQAFELGHKLHEAQTRKSGEPFFVHPATVALMLTRIGADADTIIAALLHDAVEDTPLTLKEVDKLFNGHVSTLIDGVTKLSSKDTSDSPTMDLNIETLRKIFQLMQKDIRIMIIKLYDRLHNMQTIEFLKPERQQKIAQETLDVYVKIADRLSMQSMYLELQELCLRVLYPEELEALLELRERSEKKSHRVQQAMKQYIQEQYPDIAKKITVGYEPLSFDRLRAKLKTEGASATGIADFIVVFECKKETDCYEILGALHLLWPREILSFQDYINSPLLNGYKALHTTVLLSDGTRVRCKIRTHDMQEYTERGVTMYCFDEESKGIQQYLPWTRAIVPVVSDTKNSSQTFWDSLQSDILGESITIHGPGDDTAVVPKDATALDACFYLLQKEALRVQSVKVNGNDVALYTPLKHADSLQVTFSKSQTVTREWLDWTHTAFAAAKIRSAISGKSTTKKIDIGKALLEESLLQQRRGFIEEFDENTIQAYIDDLGYASLRDIYVAIADGRIDPDFVVLHVFSTQKNGVPFKAQSTVLTFHLPVNRPQEEELHKIEEKYTQHITAMNTRREKSHWITRWELVLSPQEQTVLMRTLRSIGIEHIRSFIKVKNAVQWAGILFIVFLWGLDPVVAKYILLNGVSADHLALIRVWTVFIIAAIAFGFSERPHRFSPISLRSASLWATGVCFFLVSLTSYYALTVATPSFYNAIIRLNTLIFALPILLETRRYLNIASSCGAALVGIGILTFVPDYQVQLLFSVVLLGAFAAYTAASSYFQYNARINARYTQFFFYTSLIAALASVPFVLAFDLPPVSNMQLAACIAFSAMFVALPYMLFYFLRQKTGYLTLSRSINFSFFITVAAEAILFNDSYLVYTALSGIFLIAANLLSSRQTSREMEVASLKR
jgi:GTP pyrophosphokinase